jgi:hypothetical protein
MLNDCLPDICADNFMISATCRCEVSGLITSASFSLAGFQGLDLCYEKEVTCILLAKIL